MNNFKQPTKHYPRQFNKLSQHHENYGKIEKSKQIDKFFGSINIMPIETWSIIKDCFKIFVTIYFIFLMVILY